MWNVPRKLYDYLLGPEHRLLRDAHPYRLFGLRLVMIGALIGVAGVMLGVAGAAGLGKTVFIVGFIIALAGFVTNLMLVLMPKEEAAKLKENHSQEEGKG